MSSEEPSDPGTSIPAPTSSSSEATAATATTSPPPVAVSSPPLSANLSHAAVLQLATAVADLI